MISSCLSKDFRAKKNALSRMKALRKPFSLSGKDGQGRKLHER